MSRPLRSVITGLAMAAILSSAGAAPAQIIQLGGSESEIKAMLSARGYDRIDVVERGLSSTTYQACLGTDRLQFKVYWDGRIGSPDRIGGCRPFVDEAQVRRLLAARGYERISVENRGGTFIAVACRGNNRIRVNVSPHGDIGPERVFGACQPELAPADIVARLEAEGYDRVSFQDRQLPRYVAHACSGTVRYELVMNRFGEIAERRQIGQCERPVDPFDLPALLARKGIERAVVTDARPPRFRAEGCRGGYKVEVTVSRFGEILDEVRIGRCQPELTAAQLSALLRDQGYSNVRVTDNGANGFLAIVCEGNRRSELLINRYGEVSRQVALGPCASPTLREVIARFGEEGVRQARVYVEGCERGRRVRVEIDEYGEIRDRERLGGC